MLSFYIVVSIILLLIIIYLIIVLIQFKKRKRNAWLWFMEKENVEEENNLIPIRYDINDPANKNENEKNDIEFSSVFLNNNDNNNNNQGFKNSKYSKISS